MMLQAKIFNLHSEVGLGCAECLSNKKTQHDAEYLPETRDGETLVKNTRFRLKTMLEPGFVLRKETEKV